MKFSKPIQLLLAVGVFGLIIGGFGFLVWTLAQPQTTFTAAKLGSTWTTIKLARVANIKKEIGSGKPVAKFSPGRILVQLDSDKYSLDDAKKLVTQKLGSNVSVLKQINSDMYVLEFADSKSAKVGNVLAISQTQSMAKALDTIAQAPEFLLVELDYFGSKASLNDTFYSKQWDIQKTYATTNTTSSKTSVRIEAPRSDIFLDEALLRFPTPAKTIPVGILDSGVNWKNKDLTDRMFRDVNGKILGYNTFLSSSDQEALFAQGHGNHIAGTIAAESNNNFGIAGICAECRISPLVITEYPDSTEQRISEIIQGIYKAQELKIKVLNMSIASPSSDLLGIATDRAYASSIALVAAAGNANKSVDTYGFSLNYDSVFLVGATSRVNKKASYSDYGYAVDVYAPGGDDSSEWQNLGPNYCSNPNGIVSQGIFAGHYGCSYGEGGLRYQELSGTSMATPHVTALVAMMMSRYPNLSIAEIFSIISVATEPVDLTGFASPNDQYFYQRVNFNKALDPVFHAKKEVFTNLRMSSFKVVTNLEHNVLEKGQSYTVPVQFKNVSGRSPVSKVTFSVPTASDPGSCFVLDQSRVEQTINSIQYWGNTQLPLPLIFSVKSDCTKTSDSINVRIDSLEAGVPYTWSGVKTLEIKK